ncbi:MAG: hypothetical protein K5664_01255, partial [Firmicutes bacterium]|nr:hypothetical protein [Bacillota bacterium]
EWIGENVRSECHAWSAVAIYEFTAKILGVTYKNNTILIEPYIAGRNYAKGEVATPFGKIFVDWEITDDIFTINIKLPENQKAVLTMPDGTVYNAESGVYTSKSTKYSVLQNRGDNVYGYFSGRQELYGSK